MKAMILAAGFGTRLLPYTEKTPKPLFPVAGRPLLELIINLLQNAGCDEIIINTHHLHHKIEAFVKSLEHGIPVHTSYEPVILGTGGAIKNVRDFWDSRPFLVINSDIVTDIDLEKVYTFHLNQNNPATLVLQDSPEYNNVSVVKDDYVVGFNNGRLEKELSGDISQLAFTGIQVLDPGILDFIPDHSFSSIIDAYRKMIHSGNKVKAYISTNHYWKDIGTPAHYRDAVFDKLADEAFKRAFPEKKIGKTVKIKLKGDGSDRDWYRLYSGNQSLIMADHGIRSKNSVSEIDSFLYIGRHLYEKGLPVPKIYAHDAFSGLVLMEDLGDDHLQTVVLNSSTYKKVLPLYKSVIDILINQSVSGKSGFNPLWAYQTPSYTRELILEKECQYFVDSFLIQYSGLNLSFKSFEKEFVLLAEKALEFAVTGFMHRDMQSRNILIKNNRPSFIDFQAGRIGPIQYDLASLLIDPYTNLPVMMQEELLDYCVEQLLSFVRFNQTGFRTCYRYCTLTRNFQILGAFGKLFCVKGKKYFENYIPAAVNSLKRIMEGSLSTEFPLLASTVKQL